MSCVVRRISAIVILLVLALVPAGCGDSDGDSGRELEVPKAGGDRVEPTSGGLPAGHPPIGNGPSADDAGDVARTGPFRKEFDDAGVTFSVPAGWKEMKLSGGNVGFVDAQFAVPANGQDLKLTLSRTGGGIEANIDRWKDQVSGSGEDVIVKTIDVDSRDATWVALRGRYTPPRFQQNETPQDDWTILGAAIPLEGEHAFYVKLIGPSDAVAQVRDEFSTFVQSARLR